MPRRSVLRIHLPRRAKFPKGCLCVNFIPRHLRSSGEHLVHVLSHAPRDTVRAQDPLQALVIGKDAPSFLAALSSNPEFFAESFRIAVLLNKFTNRVFSRIRLGSEMCFTLMILRAMATKADFLRNIPPEVVAEGQPRGWPFRW